MFKKKNFAGKENKTQKGYHEMSSPKIQTKDSEDSIFLKCISVLEVKLAEQMKEGKIILKSVFFLSLE